MKTILTLLIFVFATNALGADVKLDMPDHPVEVRDPVVIFIPGMLPADVGQTKVFVRPSEGITVLPSMDWDGNLYLLFIARNAGTYYFDLAIARSENNQPQLLTDSNKLTVQ